MEKRKKNKIVTIILLITTICLIVGISYAFWTSRVSQEDLNLINSDCLVIELTDVSSGISLQSAYPIRDSEAENLTPYTFTIKNVCSARVYYKVNLEIMDVTNRLNSKYIAVDINSTGKKLLSEYTSVEPTYKDDYNTAVESRELIEYGLLNGNSTVTYNLKLWMDESVTLADDATNKAFKSKIDVIASQETFLPQLATYIVDLSKTDTTNLVSDDETNDHNTRYIGADPDNYLCFDKNCTNGKWRVIGVMNNMTTSDGEIKSLVKIIRNESIGSLPWNSAQTNDWTSASLKTYLNGDWYTSNLTNYDDLIESIVWNLGGYYSPNPTITASEFYTYERGTIVYSGRTTTWSGKVALMYPSDYGYATNGGDTGRDVCLSTQLYNWSSNSDCYSNDFLYLVSSEWQLSPYSPDSVGAYHVAGSNICSDYSRNYHEARPSLYLKSDTQILSGDGTSDSPWIIGEDSVK